MEAEYKLTYFNYRGLAEPIRLIFKLAKVPFEDIRLEWNDEWNNTLKAKYPWGSLPVLEYGDLKLGQSQCILRFLAKKFNLVGSDEFEAAQCDELVATITDLREEWTKGFVEFNPEKKQSLMDKFMHELNQVFTELTVRLKNNGGKWFVGDSITWADVYIAYYMQYFKTGLGSNNIGTFDKFSDLQKFQSRVFALPELAEWIAVRPKTDF